MGVRIEEVKTYNNIVICDSCEIEVNIGETPSPMNLKSIIKRAAAHDFTIQKIDGKSFKFTCYNCQLNS